MWSEIDYVKKAWLDAHLKGELVLVISTDHNTTLLLRSNGELCYAVASFLPVP